MNLQLGAEEMVGFTVGIQVFENNEH